jgi:hypothetical protein
MSQWAALSALVATLGLLACGGGSSAGDRRAVEETLREASMSDDPADCRRLLTRKLMEQSSRERGAAAVRTCEEETETMELPDRVSVDDVVVDGSEARGDVAFEGSSLDGQEVTMALVEGDGTWKVDEMVAFAELDREALILEIGRDLYGRVNDRVEARAVECFLARLESLGDPGLEALVLDPSPEPLLALAEGCYVSADA